MKVEILVLENREAIKQREEDVVLGEKAPITPKYYTTELNFRIAHLNNYTIEARYNPPQIIANIAGEHYSIVHSKKVQEAFDYELNHR